MKLGLYQIQSQPKEKKKPIRVYLEGQTSMQAIRYGDEWDRDWRKKEILAQYNMQGVSWFDKPNLTPGAFAKKYLKTCDTIIVDLTPPTGLNADPIPYAMCAYAYGTWGVEHPVNAYSNNAMPYAERQKRYYELNKNDGLEVENFGLGDNLMTPAVLYATNGEYICKPVREGGMHTSLDNFEEVVERLARREKDGMLRAMSNHPLLRENLLDEEKKGKQPKVFLSGWTMFLEEKRGDKKLGEILVNEMKSIAAKYDLIGVSGLDTPPVPVEFENDPVMMGYELGKLTYNLIDDCDAVLSNFTQFRGNVDPGTFAEYMYVMACGKPAWSFSNDGIPFIGCPDEADKRQRANRRSKIWTPADSFAAFRSYMEADNHIKSEPVPEDELKTNLVSFEEGIKNIAQILHARVA